MLKAKLVVKQGQKVMGLYLLKIARPHNKEDSSVFFSPWFLICNIIQTQSKDSREEIFHFLFYDLNFSVCKYCIIIEFPKPQSRSGDRDKVREKVDPFKERKSFKNIRYRIGRQPYRSQRGTR